MLGYPDVNRSLRTIKLRPGFKKTEGILERLGPGWLAVLLKETTNEPAPEPSGLDRVGLAVATDRDECVGLSGERVEQLCTGRAVKQELGLGDFLLLLRTTPVGGFLLEPKPLQHVCRHSAAHRVASARRSSIMWAKDSVASQKITASALRSSGSSIRNKEGSKKRRNRRQQRWSNLA
jgi:hypothetical protein